MSTDQETGEAIAGFFFLSFLCMIAVYIFSDGSVEAIEEIDPPANMYKFINKEHIGDGLYAALENNEHVRNLKFTELSIYEYAAEKSGISSSLMSIVSTFSNEKKGLDELDDYFEVVKVSFIFDNVTEEKNIFAYFVTIKGKLFFFINDHSEILRPWAIPLGIFDMQYINL